MMPMFLFERNFNWTDPRLVTVTMAYKKGHCLVVTTPCAEAALRAGAGKFIKRGAVKKPEQVNDSGIEHRKPADLPEGNQDL